jgi:hypothetical protein
MINVTYVDRSLRARTSPAAVRTRHRFQAITAGVAMAVVGGLSIPAIAAAAATPADGVNSAADTSAATSANTAGTASTSKTEAFVADAVSKLTGDSISPILASTKSDTSIPVKAGAKAGAKTGAKTGVKAAGKVEARATKAAEKAKTAGKAKARATQKVAVPTVKQLHPRGVPGNGQQSLRPSDEQLRNVREIVKAGQKMGLSPRAQVVAVGTAMQESTLKNLGHLGDRNDHDSQGLFQQRPSSGWGTPKQITNPRYAATAFYKGLVNVDGWERMPLTRAAQSVQVSAYPDHYAKWEKQAGELVLAFYGAGPYAKQAASLK